MIWIAQTQLNHGSLVSSSECGIRSVNHHCEEHCILHLILSIFGAQFKSSLIRKPTHALCPLDLELTQLHLILKLVNTYFT